MGIQLFDHERLIAVADSNRFTTSGRPISILDYGPFSAGLRPPWGPATSRQWGLSDNGRFSLHLTEFSSNILGIFPVADLVNDVRPFDPHLGFGSPFAPFGSWTGPRT